MTNAEFEMEDYRDIETLNLYRERLEKGYEKSDIMRSLHAKSRDNARTPMQWNDSKNAGFSDGTPWIKVNPNYTQINAAKQIAEEDSVFHCYQKLIQLRKKYDVFTDGVFELLFEEDENLFAYTRSNASQQLFVVCNFYGGTVPCALEQPAASMRLLVSNYKDAAQMTELRPYEARMYIKE